MIKIFRDKKTLILTAIAAIAIAVLIRVLLNLWLPGWYQYISNRSDFTYIIKGDTVAVYPNIVSLDTAPGYFVGLRLPAQNMECDNGDSLKIIMKNERHYFIFNHETGEMLDFESQPLFEAKLKALGLSGSVSLDFTRFRSIWDKYSKYYDDIDVSKCRDLPLH